MTVRRRRSTRKPRRTSRRPRRRTSREPLEPNAIPPLEPLVDNWTSHQKPYVGRSMRPNGLEVRSPTEGGFNLRGKYVEAHTRARTYREIYSDGEIVGYAEYVPPSERPRRGDVWEVVIEIEPFGRAYAPGVRGIETVAEQLLGGGTLTPNKGARALGDRPAMKTRFGDTLDEEVLDTLRGAKGRDVDAAMKRYETFHAKAPIRVAELVHDLPDSWVCVGDALAVMYRTDKWKKDGTDEDYKHLHDAGDNKPYPVRKGVRFFEPASAVRGGRAQRLPVAKPKALTLLGYCLGAFVRKDSDGEQYETNPRGCYLFSSPSGNALFLYSPNKQSDGSSGFLAAMAGGKLRVLKDGIDG